LRPCLVWLPSSVLSSIALCSTIDHSEFQCKCYVDEVAIRSDSLRVVIVAYPPCFISVTSTLEVPDSPELDPQRSLSFNITCDRTMYQYWYTLRILVRSCSSSI
jgi:hypothetical protein